MPWIPRLQRLNTLHSTALLLVTAIGLAACSSPRPDSSESGRDPVVENLHAFAKLYGYVRYFHPSDEAAALDWEAFALHGVRRVRDAASPVELQTALDSLFEPIAPTLQLYGSEEPAPPLPAELGLAHTAGIDVVAWQHLGVGFGQANSAYRSVRLNRVTELTAGASSAVLAQAVDASGLRGRDVRLTGVGKAAEPGARVHLWLRVDLEGGGQGFFDNMADRPVMAPEWTRMEIQGPVAANAARVVLGAILSGGASALDDLRLEVLEEDEWTPVALANGDFEVGEEGTPAGWSMTGEGWEASLTGSGSGAEAPSGERFFEIAPTPVRFTGPLFDQRPALGEVAVKELGGGLMARIPLALPSRDGHTLGAVPPEELEALEAGLAQLHPEALDATDESLRVADVIIAWNVFQHFYPYFDVVDVDWDAVLHTALDRALNDDTSAQLTTTLRWMVAQLQDGHGRVSAPQPAQAGPPFIVDWIENEVVVVASTDTARFRPGDVIQTMDGASAADRLAEEAELYSGSPQWRRWRALSQFGWGGPGSEIELELRRGNDRLTERVARTRQQPLAETRPADVEEIEEGIYYVNLDRVEMAAFERHVEALARAKGVVFDLRGYPNGNHLVLTHLSDEPLQSAYWHVPQIIYPDHDGEAHFAESRWNLPPSQPRLLGTIVFLTDGRAISYAESVMGIVEHYRLGEIVGQPTAGANGNVNPFSLPGGYTVSWTGMQVVKHDGSTHHTVGIQPTVPTTRTIQGVREGRDELLERAVELIQASDGSGAETPDTLTRPGGD